MCRWFHCKLFALLLLLFGLAHLLFSGNDLGWMPSPPDLSHVTDSPKKKHPDGPLVLGDGILVEAEGKKLIKAVLMEPAEIDVKILQNEEEEKDEKQKKKKRRRRLPISEQFLARFRQLAKQLHKRTALPNGFILFALINKAYLDLTLNWLCNLYALPQNGRNSTESVKSEAGGNVDLLKATLLVALDGGETCKEVKRTWPQVNCLSLFEKPKKGVGQALLDADEQKQYNEPLSWGRLLYVHILTARANLLAALAEAKVPFVLAESDAIWLRNPFVELFPGANQLEDVDLAMPLNSGQDAAKGERFAFDPMLAYATNGTRRLLQEMRRTLNREPSTMDQDLLNQLCARQYAGVVCREFGPEDIADGAWFKLSEPERARAAKSAGHWPLIVNNNFYVGVHNKMARQAINGLWFLSAKQKQCNLAKAKRILQKYGKA